MLNRILLLFFLTCILGSLKGQETYKITYHAFRDGVMMKQDPIVLFVSKDKYVITKESIISGQVRYPAEQIFANVKNRKGYRTSFLSAARSISSYDPGIYNKLEFVQQDTGAKKILRYDTKLAKTSINSNAIEVWYTNALGLNAAPNFIGQDLGLVLEYRRNGNTGIRVAAIEKLKSWPKNLAQPSESTLLDDLSYKDQLWKSRFIQIPIFQNEQICFQPGIQSDSVLRFAEGTVIVKRVKIPEISSDSQAFIEVVQKSNGDAYDRTGSVFLVSDDQKQTFFDGMQNGMNSLPMYTDEKGVAYPGMVRTEGFSPVLELMRFFTPFGVSHFNDRVKLKGKTWQDSVSYRQDISEFISSLSGKEVYIGTYIGNYDKGGHKISLELTIHPGGSNYASGVQVMPLFNTTNVMEMGGQGYPTMYAYEKGLEVKFKLDKDLKNVRLRYITTGHGGWGNGDEFVPKANSIFLDGELKMKFTPWRLDCGSYRLYNPVSGNFENGLSSSELSRSNWCPGTITNPVFIDLGDLAVGEHTIRVQIPQGPKEGDGQSFWNTSGCLVYE